ncbi:MAG: hypothetical protein WCB32_16385 [Pseudolabrys sp.]|jgi:hypothetical protein
MTTLAEGNDMTATEDRIDKLFGQILIESIPRGEIEPELRTLFYAFDDPYYREKMQSAIDNAAAYASPNKPEKFGGAEKVRTFLLHDLTAARRRIVQLRDVGK